MLVAAWSAQAEGARGDGAAAAAALRSSEEAYGPQVAVFLPELELARAWERASVGQTTAAQTHAVRAAQIARQSGMYAVEMLALHTAVRFDDRSQTERLDELAKTLNTPLAEAIAAHARGLADHDGDLLDAAADRFADLGAMALAADAAAQAAREHARTGHRGKEIKSSTRAHGLASQHEIRTPAVDAAAQPLPISDREREIVMLVAAGFPTARSPKGFRLSADGGGTRLPHLRQARHRAPRPAHPLSEWRSPRDITRRRQPTRFQARRARQRWCTSPTHAENPATGRTCVKSTRGDQHFARKIEIWSQTVGGVGVASAKRPGGGGSTGGANGERLVR